MVVRRPKLTLSVISYVKPIIYMFYIYIFCLYAVMSIPKYDMKRINAMIYKFIQKGRTERLKRDKTMF